MKRALAIVAVLVLVVAACGDDGDSSPALDADDQSVADDLTEEILGGSTGDVPFSDAEAACFATGLVGEFGGEVMAEAIELEFEEFMAQASNDQRMTVVDTMLGCIDFGEMMVAEFDGAIGDDAARCLGDAFAASDVFRAALADSFDSAAGGDPFEDDALLAELLPAMLECLSAEELVDLGGTGG